MTKIHISIRKQKTGGLDPVTGLMRFRPVQRPGEARPAARAWDDVSNC